MDRKHFLKGATALPLLSLVPGNTFAKDTNTQTIHKANEGHVKITALKYYEFKKAGFVKIETDSGVSGWGEVDGSNRKLAGYYIAKNLDQYVVGKDPFHSEGIWQEAYLKGIESGIGGLHPGSLSGIDSALWDLKGKLLGVPVHRLLGGNGKDKIQVYGSYGRNKDGRYQTPKEMAARAARFVEDGYRGVKARMQIRQENVNPYPDDIFDIVKEVRAAIGDSIKLFIDFNNGYTPAEATVMGRKLYEHFNIAALEEPVFQQDYTGLRQVVDALDIPVMAGEHEYNKWMMKDLITIANVDIVNADVIKCGGITDCRKTAAMCHAFGKQVMVHNAKPTLASAASLQLLGSIPNAGRFQEYAGERRDEGYAPLFDLFENKLEFEDGYLKIPQEPGLGLIPIEKQMEKHKRN
ncbi:MAG: mandelate racemase/muconate lactonizing enzyme family protein [Bacteroidota bacterium]